MLTFQKTIIPVPSQIIIQAIKLNPESPYPYWGCGSTYAKRGERKLAEQDYATATHLENENVRRKG